MKDNTSNKTQKHASISGEIESLGFAKAIINSTSDSVIVTDVSGKITFWNNGAAQLYKYTKEEVIGKHVTMLYTKENVVSAKDRMNTVIAGGSVFNAEVQIIDKFKNNRTVLLTLNGIRDENGQITHILGFTKDVTEKKETEQKFSQAFDNSPIPISILNIKKGKRIAVNNKFIEIFGYTKKELLDEDNFHAHNIVGNQEDFKLSIKKILKEGSLFEYPLTLKTKTGELRHILLNSTKVDKNNDEVYISSYIDVTERINSEKKLQESKVKFEILSDVTFEGIIIHDKGVPVDMNSSAHNMFGYTRHEYENKDLNKLIIHKNYQEIVTNNIQNDSEFPYEVVGVKKDGTEFPVEVEGKTFISKDNKKLRVTALRDITDHKIAEQKIKDSEASMSAILNSLPSSVCVIDDTGNILEVNDSWIEFGKNNGGNTKNGSFAEYNYFDVCRSDFENEAAKLISQGLVDLLEGKITKFEYEYPCHSPDKKQWFLMKADLMKTKEKQIVISHIDITSRKIAEEDLKQTLSRLNLTVDTAKLGLWTFDFNTNELIWNDRQFEIYGITPAEFDNTFDAFRKMVHPEDLDLMDTAMNKIYQKQSVFGVKFRILHSSGEVRYIDSSATPIFIEDELIKLTGVNRDITETIKAQNELEKAYKDLSLLKEQLQEENIDLKETVSLSFSFQDIIYASGAFSEVLDNVEVVAKTNATVLILGETGTGKELIAKAVHNNSSRKDKPLIKVNCAAIPHDLIESELFGHEKGAFTGADRRKIGKFELANGGTVFLDEIGEMPITLQPKLLRAIQELEIERIGGTETIKLNVRIIAATNRDLQIEIDNNRFREDLFFRLNVFPIVIPPLRDRPDDIPVLVNYFVDKFSARYHKNIEYISSDHLDAMKSYDWPGNIRELENLIERGVIISNEKVLKLDFFANNSNDNNFIPIDESINSTSFVSLDRMQKEYIEKVLKSTNGRISGPNGAAKILDVNANTLRDRIKKLGINKKNSGS